LYRQSAANSLTRSSSFRKDAGIGCSSSLVFLAAPCPAKRRDGKEIEEKEGRRGGRRRGGKVRGRGGWEAERRGEGREEGG